LFDSNFLNLFLLKLVIGMGDGERFENCLDRGEIQLIKHD